ncbi:hypothetical protein, partial [Pseudomonas savastanoi]
MLAPVLTPLPTFPALLFGLSGCLVDFGAQAATSLTPGNELTQLTPGAKDILRTLRDQGMPCAWLDELPETVSATLAEPVSDWMIPAPRPTAKWPAPDACWMALMALKVSQLDGCVLISGDPRLLQSGLNAGLWTIGLASCG